MLLQCPLTMIIHCRSACKRAIEVCCKLFVHVICKIGTKCMRMVDRKWQNKKQGMVGRRDCINYVNCDSGYTQSSQPVGVLSGVGHWHDLQVGWSPHCVGRVDGLWLGGLVVSR